MIPNKKLCWMSALILVLAAVSFAGERPEWRPLKFGFAVSGPAAAPAPPAAPVVEISIVGGYASGFGPLTANSVAANLLTGRFSPYFGQGFTDFFWGPSGGFPIPGKIDGAMTAPMLLKDGGALAGIKLGFNVSPMFQVEAYFQYGFSGYSIDPTILASIQDSWTAGQKLLKSYFGNSTLTNTSVAKAGKTIMGGVNLNLCFPGTGPVVPYLSLGAGIFSVSDYPSIMISETHTFGTAVSYGMNITNTSALAVAFNGGAGMKFNISPTYGLKLEARANLAPVSLTRTLATPFSGSGGWTTYTNFNAQAMIEKGSGIFLTALIGFFFGF